jgi:Ca-activated chloride channel homolog
MVGAAEAAPWRGCHSHGDLRGRHMSFGHPLLLLTLLVVPAAILALRLAERRRVRYAVRYPNVDVLAGVVAGRSWRRHVPTGLALLALAVLCVAVARPHATALVPKERATIILVLDTSGSMESNDVRPTRFAAAQRAVRTFLARVPPRIRIGMIAFAGDAEVAAPPTTDRGLLRTSLEHISDFPITGGTAIGDALAVAVEVAEQAISGRPYKPPAVLPIRLSVGRPKPDTKRLASILFLSDGHQTQGTLQPLEGARRAKDAKIPVYTVSLGTPGGVLGHEFHGTHPIPVPPDPATLAAIADTTGGKFFDAQSAGALQAAYSKLGSSLGRRPGKTEVTYEFLAGAAGLLVAAGFLSALWSPRLP